MDRPTGVTVSSIVLFLLASLQLFGLTFLLIGAIAFLYGYSSVSDPNIANPSLVSGWMRGIFLLMAVIGGLFLAWVIATAVGLLRLRNWARISTLILAGCIAVYALFSLFGTAISLFLPSALPPTAPPQMLVFFHFALAMSALFHISLMALAVWWLVYFNRAAIRAAFQPESAHLPPSPEATAHWPSTTEPLPPPAKKLFPPAPIAISIIGWFWLISSPFLLILALLPFPAFLFGKIIGGPVKIVLYLVLAALIVWLGWNLLQLRESARRVALAFAIFGILHSLLIFVPAYSRRLMEYTNQTVQNMTFGLPNQGTESYVIVARTHLLTAYFGVIFAVAINLTIVWLLHRNRAAFQRPTA